MYGVDDQEAGHADDAAGTPTLADRLLDQRDGAPAGVLVERSVAPDRWPAGDPRRGGDPRDLAEQLDGRGAAADDDDVRPANSSAER